MAGGSTCCSAGTDPSAWRTKGDGGGGSLGRGKNPKNGPEGRTAAVDHRPDLLGPGRPGGRPVAQQGRQGLGPAAGQAIPGLARNRGRQEGPGDEGRTGRDGSRGALGKTSGQR